MWRVVHRLGNTQNQTLCRRVYARLSMGLLLAGLAFGSGVMRPIPAQAATGEAKAGEKTGMDAPPTPDKSAQKPTAKDNKAGNNAPKGCGGQGGDTQGADKPKAKQDAQEPADAQEDLINADRPGIANGSAVIGPRRFQIETGVQQGYFGGGNATSRLLTVPTLLRFGIDTRYEIRVENPTGYSDLSATSPGSGTQHTQGIGPTSIGFKRQFQSSKGLRHPSLGTIVRFFPGSGSGAFQTRHATYDALLCMDWDIAPKLSLNPNIGFGVYEDGSGVLYGNFQLANTLTYAVTTHLGVFFDFALQTPETSAGADSLIYDAGVTYILGRNVQLDVSVGTGAKGRTSPHPFWAAGVSARF